MKKLLIIAVVTVVSVAANAASFKWTAGNIYGPDGTTKWTGTVSLYAEGIAEALSTPTASNGAVSNVNFSNDALVAGESYNFYFVLTDGSKEFTSTTKTVAAQATSTQSISFGNMASATQNASNWAAVPEPTSGLLMLLGVAGLALKRKRA